MAKYEKWLGAGVGLLLTGNPLGGLLGFMTGALVEQTSTGGKRTASKTNVTELEMNLIVLASYLIKIDGRVSLEEIAFTQKFLDNHFDEKYSAERSNIINHCLHKEYDLNVVCGRLRIYAPQPTRIQIVHFLFDLAMSDGELNERENFFIFKVAGYLNVNDVHFRRIKTEHTVITQSVYEVFGIKRDAPFTEIRSRYRKLVIQYHPDRNQHLSEKERKALALKFQQIQEAYDRIKEERGEK